MTTQFKLSLGVMMGGILILVVGLTMADMIIDQIIKAAVELAEPTYSNVDHGSASSINGLLVVIYYIAMIALSFGMIGGGGYGGYKQLRGGGMM